MAAPRTTLPPIVITGASGFVGRRLVQLAATHAPQRPVTLLLRHAAAAVLPPLPSAWRLVQGDLAQAPLPPDAVPAGSVIVHLAAATGRLAPSVMRTTNVEGTRHLLDAARAAAARHVVFVSSIAAGFADRRWYPYAEAKRDGEALVRASGLPFTIVRPTMVFGEGSPVQDGLLRLALGAAPLIPGAGAVQVQPVHVDDLAALLLALALAPEGSAVPVEVGGATRLSMRALLAAMRAAHGLPARRALAVPLAPIRRALAIAEVTLGGRLPVTAGQLASFVNDSVAEPHPLVARLLPAPQPLATMLASVAGQAAPAAAGVVAGEGGEAAIGRATEAAPQASTAPGHTEQLAREFRRFSRHLGTRTPSPASVTAYIRAAPSAGMPVDRMDDWLLSIARASATGCALADAYARFARPYGALRRRLVLALAVLESSAATHGDYDSAIAAGTAVTWLALGAAGAGWVLRSIVALLLVGPLHLTAIILGRGAPARG